MSKAKPTRAEMGAILEAMLDANCPSGCRCIFCRTFDDGYITGLQDAQTVSRRETEALMRKVKARRDADA
jgi:hypothetical protein